MYITRNIEKTIIDTSKQFACITMYGARQVGKSTMIKKLFGDKFAYVTFDDFNARGLAKRNPKMFLETYEYPIIIDEVQKVPEILDEIKIIIDNKKYEWLNSGKASELLFILTGSNQFELQDKIVESLAGRTAIFNLSSLSLIEQNPKVTKGFFNPDLNVLKQKQKENGIKYYTRKEIFEYIFRGGMPEYVSNSIDRNEFFSSYLSTYIEKDVKSIINADSEYIFLQFISYVAFKTGCQVNYDDISRNIGIDVKTVKKWLSILKTSGIITIIEPYLKNRSNRVIKTPKLYFMDTGLCSYLCRWNDAKQLEESQMAGAFYETYVISEIIKSFYNDGIDPFLVPNYKPYYYRDKDGNEVDLIIESIDGIYPIEIKKGINPVSFNKIFNYLKKYDINVLTGLVIDSCERIMPINEEVYYCPIPLIGL
ncbi:MAG: DUF4143 domain-containing protein [Clostridia bacterium]|nr:DUF4143 domain-containing protein [Clostridia bacterium]